MTKVAIAVQRVCQNQSESFTRNKIASVPFASIRFDRLLKVFLKVTFKSDVILGKTKVANTQR